MTAVLALGATGLVGSRLLEGLTEAGHQVLAVSRRHQEPRAGVSWHQRDLNDQADIAGLPDCEVMISSVSIWTTAKVAQHLVGRGLRRVIAFSSTSALTKTDAGDPDERNLAARLLAGEGTLGALGPTVQSTILRPTMIYGRQGDRNVERIAAQLARVPIFPLVGGGRGLRQPVHADDVAVAALQALKAPATAGRTYAVAGAEVLSVKEMIDRVGRANGTRARFVSVPPAVARMGLRAAAVLPQFRGIPTGALERMTKDLVFDHSAAVADFGYDPRGFEPPNYRM